jgi:DNA-directed RNA polymerase specialized sigma24 family protein
MKQQMTYPSFEELVLGEEHTWQKLYTVLRPPATLYVHMYAIPSWKGQVCDLVDDVVQETVIRMYGQTQKFATEEHTSIRSLEAFCHTIARNYCRDLWRKERRLSHFPEDNYTSDALTSAFVDEDQFEDVLDKLATMAIILVVARIIAAFPEKQRTALLIDQARYTDFRGEPSTLQQALAQVGIRLQDYQHALPATQAERLRHNSLVSIAYKRLREVFHTEHAHLVA